MMEEEVEASIKIVKIASCEDQFFHCPIAKFIKRK